MKDGAHHRTDSTYGIENHNALVNPNSGEFYDRYPDQEDFYVEVRGRVRTDNWIEVNLVEQIKYGYTPLRCQFQGFPDKHQLQLKTNNY